MGDDPIVMVRWRKGWTPASHSCVVEIGEDTLWFGRLGTGGADWGTSSGSLPDSSLRQASRGAGGGVAGGVGMSLGQAAARKVLDKYRAEVVENLRRYRVEGRAALAGDENTTEWPLTCFADARLVKRLPLTAPTPVQRLGPGFVAVTIERKHHYFAGLPDSFSAEQFHGLLHATPGPRAPQDGSEPS